LTQKNDIAPEQTLWLQLNRNKVASAGVANAVASSFSALLSVPPKGSTIIQAAVTIFCDQTDRDSPTGSSVRSARDYLLSETASVLALRVTITTFLKVATTLFRIMTPLPRTEQLEMV
jgi:hypothetical protein